MTNVRATNVRATSEQEIIFAEYSKLVGKVLTIVEASLSDKQQRDSCKKIVEQTIYDSRNALLRALQKEV